MEETFLQLQQQVQDLTAEVRRQRELREAELKRVAEMLTQNAVQLENRLDIERGRSTASGGGDRHEEERRFMEWVETVEDRILSRYGELKPLLEWALDQEEPITDEVVIEEFLGADVEQERRIPRLVDKTYGVYCMVEYLTQGKLHDIVAHEGEN